jgi:hypothetical protein
MTSLGQIAKLPSLRKGARAPLTYGVLSVTMLVRSEIFQGRVRPRTAQNTAVCYQSVEDSRHSATCQCHLCGPCLAESCSKSGTRATFAERAFSTACFVSRPLRQNALAYCANRMSLRNVQRGMKCSKLASSVPLSRRESTPDAHVRLEVRQVQ